MTLLYNKIPQPKKWDEELVLHGRGCDNNDVKQKRGSTWIPFFPCYLWTAETSYDTVFSSRGSVVDEYHPTWFGERRPLDPLIIPLSDESIHPSWANGGDILRHYVSSSSSVWWTNVIPHDWGSVVHWLHSSSLLATRAFICPGPDLRWTLTSSSIGELTEGLCIRCNNRGLVIALGCGSLSSIHIARGWGEWMGEGHPSIFLSVVFAVIQILRGIHQRVVSPFSSLTLDKALAPDDVSFVDWHLCIQGTFLIHIHRFLSRWAPPIYWMNAAHPKIHCVHLLWPIH